MPYDAISDLPETVRGSLPKRAQKIYLDAFNSAWAEYAGTKDREEMAHRVAWSAVKRVYKKEREKWVPKKG
ncbi:MAG: ChaB family protein [Gammaproteobacteria bacterium]